ncbi:MAG: magnesium/cobalt transporter CorA [Cyanobacteriota bacterium]|nr:magnesium/cobalt transporter CorA [Cyanobacteriota bacterium]
MTNVYTTPGTLVIPKDAHPPKLIVIDYTQEEVRRFVTHSPAECAAFIHSDSITWLDVQGLGDAELLQQLAQVFNLHPLALEDIVNVPQRPKFEEYEDHYLLVSRMVVAKVDGFHSEQVSVVIGSRYVITFQEEPQFDCFSGVRERIRGGRGAIRQQGSDYLAYAILDALIDSFFPILETYDVKLEDLEEEAADQPTRQTLSCIYEVKRELLALRRAISPQREAIAALMREGNTLISPAVRTYLRDCYEHTIQVIETVEIYREIASSLVELYLSSVNNRLNEVVKVLTIVSTIFIPLTFIVGVYGMNFNTEKSIWNMPELNWAYGYPLVWLVMVAIAGLLLFLFWRWGWLSTDEVASLNSPTPPPSNMGDMKAPPP